MLQVGENHVVKEQNQSHNGDWTVIKVRDGQPLHDTVHISNLDEHNVNRDRLLEHLLDCLGEEADKDYARILGIRMETHPRTGAISKNALVLVASPEGASKLLNCVNGTKLEGKKLHVRIFSEGSLVLEPAEEVVSSMPASSITASPAGGQKKLRFANTDELCKVKYFAKEKTPKKLLWWQ